MPLALIPFSVPGGDHLILLDGVTCYRDPYVFFAHQFGFFRINVNTGAYTCRVCVGYLNPAFPPSNMTPPTYIAGDHNQSVSEMTVNDDWIVTDCIAPIAGTDPQAIVFNNDSGLTYHGLVPKQSGFWWNRARHPVIAGDLLYVPNDRGSYDKMNVNTLVWVSKNVSAPSNTDETDVSGSTYEWSSVGGSDTNYNAVETGTSGFVGFGAVSLSSLQVAGSTAQTFSLSGDVALSSLTVAATQAAVGDGDVALSALQVAGLATVFPVEQSPAEPANVGFAYTPDQLMLSVEANTDFTSCPLSHESPDTTFHKQPLILTPPGDSANSGTTRVVLHTRQPGGQWDTTVVGVSGG